MILIAVAARQANSQILAASSTAVMLAVAKCAEVEMPCPRELTCKTRSDRKKAQQPMMPKSNQDNPPNLVLMGASAKVIAKTANARLGNGRRDNERVSNEVTNFAI